MANDEYELGELLGRGGMGQVHIARHRSGRLVAVKRVRNTLATERLVVDRLEDEGRLLRRVSHPNVVRALDHGTGRDGLPFLVMDRAYGTPLHQLIHHHGALPHDRVAAIASQLFAGVAAIHDAQVVHADLKSHNVLVDDVDIVTIIDFGLARTMTLRPDPGGLVAGTPAYMAPELIAGGEVSAVADVYSLATILYEMLTGSTPFSGHISTILTRQLSESVEPPSRRAPTRGISSEVDRVLLRALAAAPVDRYQSVLELAAAFSAAIAHHPAAPAMFASGSGMWTEQTAVQRPNAALLELLTDHIVDRADAVIASALTRAQRMIGDRQIESAALELEAALAELGHEVAMPACSWRIETVLAALYDGLGKQERAQRMARVAYRHALQTGCPRAEARAHLLVDRLVVRPRRIARGSVGSR